MPPFSRSGRDYGYTAAIVVVLMVISFAPFVHAQAATAALTSPTCSLASDKEPDRKFDLRAWVWRGGCIRKNTDGKKCGTILLGILESLVKLREAEYAGAASVLSLLPTIGALFGAPTSEIWRLKAIVPFGGVLAMALSFGGALMPVKVEDYEDTATGRDAAFGSIISLRKQRLSHGADDLSVDTKLRVLGDKVRQRLDQRESVRLSKLGLLSGLGLMFFLFASAQAAMAVIEQGGVINWWCQTQGWVHLWYILVTFIAVLEDRVQRPFVKTYKLYVSSLPYEVETFDGQSITECFRESTVTENVAVALKQLKTLMPATLTVYGSRLRTRPRNSVMVMVSVVGARRRDHLWRLFSKTFSVTVFVLGTSLFASVNLLSLIMAIVVLTVTLGAGIFSRAIAAWIVARVAGTEPMIHVIASSEEEACQAVAEVLCLQSSQGTHFQVEIDGQIFINERRVAHRSRYWVLLLGVLAGPYNVTKVHQGILTSRTSSMGMSVLSPRSTNVSVSSAATPLFPQDVNVYPPPTARLARDANKSATQVSIAGAPASDRTDPEPQIQRTPVPSNSQG